MKSPERKRLQNIKRVLAPSPKKYTRGTRSVNGTAQGTHHIPTAARRKKIHQQVLMNHHIRAGAAKKAKQRREAQVRNALKQDPLFPNNMANYISLFMNNATMYSPSKSHSKSSSKSHSKSSSKSSSKSPTRR